MATFCSFGSGEISPLIIGWTTSGFGFLAGAAPRTTAFIKLVNKEHYNRTAGGPWQTKQPHRSDCHNYSELRQNATQQNYPRLACRKPTLTDIWWQEETLGNARRLNGTIYM